MTGSGAYLDDLSIPDAAHLALVRSPLPHARVLDVDVTAARRAPGVLEVLTAADLEPGPSRLPTPTVPLPQGFWTAEVPMRILAGDEVRYVGEAVAAVLAESRALAVDAAELVQLDLEPLPSIADPRASLEGGPPVHSEISDNVLFRWQLAGGDLEAAFSAAPVVVRGSISIPRLQAAPMEPRGCVAAFTPSDDLLTLWCSSQDSRRPQVQLAGILGWPPERVRVVVPDVGGAFGSKGGLAPEHALAALLSMRSHRPVKWVETRSENFLSAYQGRGMEVDAELALDREGGIRGLRVRLMADAGAYLLGHTAVVSATAASLVTGAYLVPAAEVTVLGAATNKVPTGPYRGAGRPEATLVIERMMDLAAAELGLDPVELRRRNLVPADSFPYRTALGTEYDSGDYPGLLDRALELADYGGEHRRLELARQEGRVRGMGVAVAVESSGTGLWDAATATVLEDGRVLLLPAASEHGQGHATTFAQIAADALEVEPDRIEVRSGDSAEVPPGVGTFGSRSVTVGGSAVLLALDDLKRRCLAWAAYLLDVPEEELRWAAGGVAQVGGGSEISLAKLAAAAHARTGAAELPELRGQGRFALPGLAYGSSACVATVEVDPETGRIEVERLISVDDAGTVINPLLAEGQVIGASVQGLAAALFEEVVHDPDGQPLSTSFMEYLVPTAADLATEMVTEFRPTCSPLSPLGTKGVGESGSIVVPAAVANAVSDALAPFGISHADLPFTPERIWRLIGGAPTWPIAVPRP